MTFGPKTVFPNPNGTDEWAERWRADTSYGRVRQIKSEEWDEWKKRIIFIRLIVSIISAQEYERNLKTR